MPPATWVRVVAFNDLAEQMYDSPFEATPIPAPMKAQVEGAEVAGGPGQAEALQL